MKIIGIILAIIVLLVLVFSLCKAADSGDELNTKINDKKEDEQL